MMPNRQILDNSDPGLSEESFEESAELLNEEELELERDLATEEMFDTQHGDGHTYNPQQAWEQGLTYTPPTDPPVVPGDDRQGADIAAGFAMSMEDTSPDEEVLPERVDNNDDELANDIYTALRNNSETAHLTEITVRVRDGVVTLLGTVPGDEDLPMIDSVLSDMEGIEEVRWRLDTVG
ncbi:MAG: BON domain-containing protein [Ardenticatenaceae bacterium]